MFNSFEKPIVYIIMFSALILGLTLLLFQNQINAVLGFIVIFLISASLLIYLGAEFLAMVYFLVYIGAVAVLFLFMVMLLNSYSELSKSIRFDKQTLISSVTMLASLVGLYKTIKAIFLRAFFYDSLPKQNIVLSSDNEAIMAALKDKLTIKAETTRIIVNDFTMDQLVADIKANFYVQRYLLTEYLVLHPAIRIKVSNN